MNHAGIGFSPKLLKLIYSKYMEINFMALLIQIDELCKSVMSSVHFDGIIKPNLNLISNKSFTKNTILIAHLFILAILLWPVLVLVFYFSTKFSNLCYPC